MKPMLGLDIGSRELRMIEASGRQLTRHAEVLLPEGALVEGMPTPIFSSAVRAALEQGQFRSTTVRVAISEAGTAFRDFDLPMIPASELRSAVVFEGRRLIPMEPADVYFAWHAARRPHGFAVYLVAARRAMIDGVLGALSSTGLQVDRIDLKPLALARGMGVSEGLLLEWGAGEATLVLMVNGRPRFFRTFALDAPPEEPQAQVDELSFSVDALVKFMRGAAPDITIGPSMTLSLGGRFAFFPDGAARAAERFPFRVTEPPLRMRAAADFPWQAHFAGIGLLQQQDWRGRLTPAQGGDIRVAA